MAGQINYQLKTNIKFTDLLDLIAALQNNSLKLHKKYLTIEDDNNTLSSITVFDVKYDDDESKNLGNISSGVLHSILSGISGKLSAFAPDISQISIPPEKSKIYKIFRLDGEYKITTSKEIHEEIIAVLSKVATGKIETEDNQEKTHGYANINDFTTHYLSNNIDDLKDSWKEIQKHLQALIKSEKDDKTVSLNHFGQKTYAFKHVLNAFNKYHEAFKKALPQDKNYNHKDGSKEKKNLNALEAIDKLFPEDGVIELLLITELESKSTADDLNLERFNTVYTAAIKSLKKEPEEIVSAGSGESDEDGGEESEDEEVVEEKETIEFTELLQRVESQLIEYIYDNYYKVKEETPQSRQYYLDEIKIQVIPEIDLQSILQNKLNSTWSHKLIEDKIIDDEDLVSLITQFIEGLQGTIEEILESFDEYEDKEDVPLNFDDETTSNTVFTLLKENNQLNNIEKEDWNNLDSKGKEKHLLNFDYWKKLTTRERRELLSSYGLLPTPLVDVVKSNEELLEELSQSKELLNDTSEEILKIIARELNLETVALNSTDKKASKKQIELALEAYLSTNPKALTLFLTKDNFNHFINKYGYGFALTRDPSFTATISDHFHFAHRKKIQREIFKGFTASSEKQFKETLHYIIAQAALSNISPILYIESLSEAELKAFFASSLSIEEFKIIFGADFEFDKEYFKKLKELLIEYTKATLKVDHLEELTDTDKEIDKSEFIEDFTFLKKQGLKIFKGKVGGGEFVYKAITKETIDEESEEKQQYLAQLNQFDKEEYNKIEQFKRAVWTSYSLEQQEVLQAQALQTAQIAQNQAIYQWEKTLEQQLQQQQVAKQQATKQQTTTPQQTTGQPTQPTLPPRSKEDKQNSLIKGATVLATAGVDAAISAIIPGGVVFAKFIPNEVKIVIAAGIGVAIAALVGLASWAISGLTGGFLSNSSAGAITRSAAGQLRGGSQLSRVPSSFASDKLGESFLKDSFSKTSLKAIATKTTSIATVTIAATAGISIWGGLILSNNIHSAFLMRVPEVEPNVGDSSKYVILEKKSLDGIDFDNPQEITYTLSITPKVGYEIELIAPPLDDFSFTCNEETRSDECPSNTNSPEFSNYQNFISRMIDVSGTVLRDNETLELGTYTVPFDSKYRDASVENILSINFNVIEEGEVVLEEESASTSETICFGECPKLKEGCWPTDGRITRVPYGDETHSNADAVDIAGNSPKVYSTSAGEACFFNTQSGIPIEVRDSNGELIRAFGNHVLVKSGSYALLYAHLANISEPSGTCLDIEAGKFLGNMGTTGNSTGVHLHWEMRVLGSGFRGFSSRISGQSFGMSGQTLLEQHAPIGGKIKDLIGPAKNVSTCYE